jgi:hypothetical protein
MSAGNDSLELIDDLEHCAVCQHSVDVRGMAQIVCLAHLDIRQPTQTSVCSEFEPKRGKKPAIRLD